MLDLSIYVTKQDVERHSGFEVFSCQCRAYYPSGDDSSALGDSADWEYIATDDSIVQIACKYKDDVVRKFTSIVEIAPSNYICTLQVIITCSL